MGWLRRIFGVPDCKCSCHSTTNYGHTTFSSGEPSASKEGSESPEENISEENYDEEEYCQITKCGSPKFQSFSHLDSFGCGYEFRPSLFYRTDDGGSSNCYQDEMSDTEQFPAFRDHQIWDSENWGHYFFNQRKIDHEFSTLGRIIVEREQGRHQLRCYVCGELIPYNAYGQLEYREHPFWKLKYCRSHNHDGTPGCSSCHRLKARDMRHVTLNDGRMICSDCLETATMDAKDCYRIYVEVKEYYKTLGMEVEERIPVHLVDIFEMNKASKKDDKGHRHLQELRGLFTWIEKDIHTIIKRPRITGDEDKIVEKRNEKYKLVSHVKARGILILYGYPRLLTESILVHEMMHAWRTLGGYPDLNLEVEEGMCQVMAHMWINSRINSLSSRPQGEMRLGEFFKYQIETNTLPHYGSGFRKGYKAVMNCGLKWTLDYIRMTGNFPP